MYEMNRHLQLVSREEKDAGEDAREKWKQEIPPSQERENRLHSRGTFQKLKYHTQLYFLSVDSARTGSL